MSSYYGQVVQQDYKKCCPSKKQPVPAPAPKCEPTVAVFECKNVSGAVNIPIINLTAAPPVPRTLGTISADLSCFKKPCVKLDFTGILVFGIEIDVDFDITFRVFKRCDNQPETEIDSFDFARTLNITAGKSVPIAFSVCDCDACPANCCTYRIAVEGSALLAITGFFTVAKGVVSLLATDQCKP